MLGAQWLAGILGLACADDDLILAARLNVNGLVICQACRPMTNDVQKLGQAVTSQVLSNALKIQIASRNLW